MASDNITLEQIPASTRKPSKHIEFNLKLAVTTLPTNRQTVLIIGQMLSPIAGTMVAPLTTQYVFSDDEAASYFGRGSLAHLMAKEAMTANPYINLSVIGVEDAEGSQVAKGSLKLTGTATNAGVISLYIATTRIDITSRNGDDAATLMASLVTALNKNPDLPVTAAITAETVTITAKNKGAFGNDIILRATSTVAGITSELTPMAGGLLEVDIRDALAAIFAARFNILVCPFSSEDALTALRDHLDKVSHPMEQRPAIGVAGWRKSFATGTTLTKKINSGRVMVGWHNDSALMPCIIAAGFAAVTASEEDPARPLNGLPILGLDVTSLESQPGRTEQEATLYNGLTPLEVGPGDKVQIVRAISTYTVNDSGTDDISLLDITTIRTLDYTRKAIVERWSLRFPREKLSERTPPKVRSETLDVLFLLERLEILENVEANKAKLLSERDLQNPGTLNVKIPADVVNGLHVIAGVIDLYL
ncbi:phage tail sheath subtilisin-like domain-containing protein [Limnobaculum xujianqingii]|uniref:phage tail sheath subtilisin-like domain-containing protein n=1 Tax=Limnobaculum xujianqingii TaxID=2738837 RepID=UPI00112B658B|nr:phage tail sheath subtilisin-like domain-containing protein [Limnobaculum xujianqingii]